MKQLYLSEWRKLLQLRVLLISFAILLALNGALAVWQVEQTLGAQEWTAEEAQSLYALYPERVEELEAYYAELQAYAESQRRIQMTTPVGEEFIETRQGIYTDGLYTGDLALLDRLMADAAVPAKYEKTMNAAIKNAQINRREYLYQGYTEEDYVCKYQARMEALYQNTLDRVEIPLTYNHGWGSYFGFELTGVLVLLMAIMIASMAFPMEKDVGMMPLVRVSRQGRQRTVFAKIAAVCSMTAVCALLLSLETFAVFGIMEGYSNASVPIQALESMRLSYLVLNIGEFFLLHLTMRVIGAVAMVFPIILLSVVFYQYVLTYASAIAYFGLHYFCYLGRSWQKTNILRYINLLAWTNGVRAVERYDATDLWNIVCGYPAAGLLLATTSALLCTVGISILYRRGFAGVQIKRLVSLAQWLTAPFRTLHQSQATTKRRVRKLRRRTTSLYATELFKLWISSRLWIVVVLLIALGSISFFRSDAIVEAHGYVDSIYEIYVDQLEGPWAPEKDTMLEEFYAEQQAIIDGYEAVKQQYREEKLTAKEFLTYQRAYMQAPTHKNVIESLMEHSEYLQKRQEEQGAEGYFFYQTGWEVIYDRSADLFLYAMLLILLTGVYAQEYGRNQFAQILRASGRGRNPVFGAKLSAVMTSAAVLSLVTQIIPIAMIARTYRLPAMEAPLWSIETYADYGGNMTLWQYFLLHTAVRLLAAEVLAVLTCAVSALSRRTIPIMTTVAALTLLPAVGSGLGLQFADKIDFLRLFEGRSVLLASMRADWLGRDFGLLLIVVCVIAVMFAALLLAAASRWGIFRRKENV